MRSPVFYREYPWLAFFKADHSKELVEVQVLKWPSAEISWMGWATSEAAVAPLPVVARMRAAVNLWRTFHVNPHGNVDAVVSWLAPVCDQDEDFQILKNRDLRDRYAEFFPQHLQANAGDVLWFDEFVYRTNLYTFLGVPGDATSADIEAAARAKQMAAHADRNPGSGIRPEQIACAQRWLIDRDARVFYDGVCSGDREEAPEDVSVAIKAQPTPQARLTALSELSWLSERCIAVLNEVVTQLNRPTSEQSRQLGYCYERIGKLAVARAQYTIAARAGDEQAAQCLMRVGAAGAACQAWKVLGDRCQWSPETLGRIVEALAPQDDPGGGINAAWAVRLLGRAWGCQLAGREGESTTQAIPFWIRAIRFGYIDGMRRITAYLRTIAEETRANEAFRIARQLLAGDGPGEHAQAVATECFVIAGKLGHTGAMQQLLQLQAYRPLLEILCTMSQPGDDLYETVISPFIRANDAEAIQATDDEALYMVRLVHPGSRRAEDMARWCQTPEVFCHESLVDNRAAIFVALLAYKPEKALAILRASCHEDAWRKDPAVLKAMIEYLYFQPEQDEDRSLWNALWDAAEGVALEGLTRDSRWDPEALPNQVGDAAAIRRVLAQIAKAETYNVAIPDEVLTHVAEAVVQHWPRQQDGLHEFEGQHFSHRHPLRLACNIAYEKALRQAGWNGVWERLCEAYQTRCVGQLEFVRRGAELRAEPEARHKRSITNHFFYESPQIPYLVLARSWVQEQTARWRQCVEAYADSPQELQRKAAVQQEQQWLVYATCCGDWSVWPRLSCEDQMVAADKLDCRLHYLRRRGDRQAIFHELVRIGETIGREFVEITLGLIGDVDPEQDELTWTPQELFHFTRTFQRAHETVREPQRGIMMRRCQHWYDLAKSDCEAAWIAYADLVDDPAEIKSLQKEVKQWLRDDPDKAWRVLDALRRRNKTEFFKEKFLTFVLAALHFRAKEWDATGEKAEAWWGFVRDSQLEPEIKRPPEPWEHRGFLFLESVSADEGLCYLKAARYLDPDYEVNAVLRNALISPGEVLLFVPRNSPEIGARYRQWARCFPKGSEERAADLGNAIKAGDLQACFQMLRHPDSPHYTAALDTLSASPEWRTVIRKTPKYASALIALYHAVREKQGKRALTESERALTDIPDWRETVRLCLYNALMQSVPNSVQMVFEACSESTDAQRRQSLRTQLLPLCEQGHRGEMEYKVLCGLWERCYLGLSNQRYQAGQGLEEAAGRRSLPVDEFCITDDKDLSAVAAALEWPYARNRQQNTTLFPDASLEDLQRVQEALQGLAGKCETLPQAQREDVYAWLWDNCLCTPEELKQTLKEAKANSAFQTTGLLGIKSPWPEIAFAMDVLRGKGPSLGRSR